MLCWTAISSVTLNSLSTLRTILTGCAVSLLSVLVSNTYEYASKVLVVFIQENSIFSAISSILRQVVNWERVVSLICLLLSMKVSPEVATMHTFTKCPSVKYIDVKRVSVVILISFLARKRCPRETDPWIRLCGMPDQLMSLYFIFVRHMNRISTKKRQISHRIAHQNRYQ